MQLLTCITVALWPSSALTTAIHPSQGQTHHQWSPPSSGRTAQHRSDDAGSRRELSARDQLDIMRLGFIPPACDRGESPPAASVNDAFSSRGGGASPNDAGGGRSGGPRPSARDQLDVIRLGFVPGRGGDTGGGAAESKSRRGAVLNPLAFASIMAFLAGTSHAVCIAKFNCYFAMMTGNVISFSMALGEGKWGDALWRASIVGSYVIGSAGARSIEIVHRNRGAAAPPGSRRGENARGHLKIVGPIAAAVFAAADRSVRPRAAPAGGGPRWDLAPLALGYGLVYASATGALGATMTQLLTGHLTKLGGAVPDRLLGPGRRWNEGAATSACVLGSFVGGGACGSRVVARLASGDFPVFTLIGIAYALVLALF